ncbi:MAG: hypothetical protein ABFD96_15320 [Armatimonadia bacterium]
MSEIKLPPGFTPWDFSFRDGPAGVSKDTEVEVYMRSGELRRDVVDSLDWGDDGMEADIFGWRVVDKAAPVEATSGAHPHAHLMLEYAKDAMTRPDPWVLWQYQDHVTLRWVDCGDGGPAWAEQYQYRRKPKEILTRVINGFTVPAGETQPLHRGKPYIAPMIHDAAFSEEILWDDDNFDTRLLERGLVLLTEEHAVAVAKAMCGIDPKWVQD